MEPLTKHELLEIIDDMRARIARDDSWEGFLNYLIPEPGDPEGTYARVEARYRFGNTEGQGGMRMIGVTIG
jgi:hypothetical protein